MLQDFCGIEKIMRDSRRNEDTLDCNAATAQQTVAKKNPSATSVGSDLIPTTMIHDIQELSVTLSAVNVSLLRC